MGEMTATNYRTNYSIIFLIISGVVWVIFKRREFFQVQYNSLLLIISQQFQLDWGWPSPASWGVYDNSFSFYANVKRYIERTIEWIAQSQSLAYWTLIIVCSLLTSLVNVGYVTVGHLKFKLKFGFEVFCFTWTGFLWARRVIIRRPAIITRAGNTTRSDMIWFGSVIMKFHDEMLSLGYWLLSIASLTNIWSSVIRPSL